MSLRKQLASVAKISIREEVLAKLMVLEYSNLTFFHELNQWQAAEKGVPSNLKAVESEAMKMEGDEEATPTDDALAKWRTPSVLQWLRMRPPLSGLDLRDYFWLARDRTGSTLSGVTMIPPNVRMALSKLLSDNHGEIALVKFRHRYVMSHRNWNLLRESCIRSPRSEPRPGKPYRPIAPTDAG